MKFQLKNIFAVLAATLLLTSCSKDDETTDTTPTGLGTLKLEFDNIYGGANFAFNTQYTNSNGDKIKATQIKYIISNVVLTKKDGTILTYSKAQSYFIVDEATAASQVISLLNIPAGDYKAVKFGIGVDKAQWELGATGQGDFLATAQTAGMMWSWAAGYKFINFEGNYTTATNTTEAQFKVHTGKTSVNSVENYNYTDVTLNFPNNALVRTNITPQVHLLVDLKHILDGTNKINLSEGGTIMGGAKLALVTANLNNMFSIDHVHND
jgi:hypothetical protein